MILEARLTRSLRAAAVKLTVPLFKMAALELDHRVVRPDSFSAIIAQAAVP